MALMDIDPPGAPEASVDPHQWQGDLTTSSGFRFFVRAAEPADEPAFAEFFTHLSPDDLRFRFLTSVARVSHERLVEMLEVDHRRTENFLAFVPGDDRVIASGMLAADAKLERGELAIAVHSAYRRRGIATCLLEHLGRYAKARGLKVLESIAARENCAVIELEQRLGFSVRPLAEEPTLVLLQRELD